MAGATETARTTWRRLLVLLVVTTGATLAWVKARRRQLPGSMPRSWSELDPGAPASLAPAPAVAEPPAPPAAETPDPPVVESAQAPAAPAAETPIDDVPAIAEMPAVGSPVAGAETGDADGPAAGPYPGSVLPLEDGSAPSPEFVVKGKTGSMRSHSPDSPYYGRTRAEVWFRTQEDASAAGFAPWAPKR